MRVAAKTEYACLAVLELAARHDDREPTQIRRIADAHGIDSRFLVQVLLQLKGAGLVASTRGAAGGYQLLKPPDEITLGEVMAAIEGPPGPLETSAARETPLTRVLRAAWEAADAARRQVLADLTFADLAAAAQGDAQPMYYI